MHNFRVVWLRLRFCAEKKFGRGENGSERLANAAFERGVLLREFHQSIESRGIDRTPKRARRDPLQDFACVSATSRRVRRSVSFEEDFLVRLRILAECIAEWPDQLHAWAQFQRLQLAFGIWLRRFHDEGERMLANG